MRFQRLAHITRFSVLKGTEGKEKGKSLGGTKCDVENSIVISSLHGTSKWSV